MEHARNAVSKAIGRLSTMLQMGYKWVTNGLQPEGTLCQKFNQRFKVLCATKNKNTHKPFGRRCG